LNNDLDAFVRAHVSNYSRRFSLLAILLVLSSLLAHAAEVPKSVFVRATCSGVLSSATLNAFKEALRTSQKYQTILTVDDGGRMDVIIQVDMSCAEHDNVAAIAIVYGLAKCFGPKNCHVTIDGGSLTATLCDSNGVGECGRLLFRSFDSYVSRPHSTPLKLE